ncbi:class I SAM-dependent methyltransferase [Kribbella qitaiheensis]|uniref:Class I SAM-dependent methyltransferase n=1 Tax=Kribbella qitaiheensis TaxID=1544730 RepID=A0A7G6WUN0_9ACTN|nr:class I SAM-dependent methyltransferase [Kribbella qitaiheensis]QNE17695.1 class I SAM-dependent methyltransferase [Kribbella qitaiheensis]
MTETLPLTGERTAPGIWHENYWYARHLAAYQWLTGLIPPAGRVLDAGCGEGYGAELLRTAGARSVVGLDYDPTALHHIGKAYPQLRTLQGNLVQQGLADDSFDLVVSMQTIEHLWDQPAFVAECARVVRPGGAVVLATPNRLTFPPGNWYHTRELSGPEFVDLVAAKMEVTTVAGLQHGPRLRAWEAQYGKIVDAQLADDHQEWSQSLIDLVRSVRATDFAVEESTPTGTADSLDLLVVARSTR